MSQLPYAGCTVLDGLLPSALLMDRPSACLSACPSVCLPACPPVVPARDPTPEEQEMEAEVEGLRKQLEELQTATPDETDTISDLKKELDEKERALYTLQVRPPSLGLARVPPASDDCCAAVAVGNLQLLTEGSVSSRKHQLGSCVPWESVSADVVELCACTCTAWQRPDQPNTTPV